MCHGYIEYFCNPKDVVESNYEIIAARYMTSFVFPWNVTLLGMAMILALVFVTMLYGIAKLRKDNPIDAIRMENI